jgi:O-antigen/teichoic acid export membrane protein
MLTIGMLITPLYLQYLGSAAFGLVAFFTLMQAWMSLLDMGLSPTLGRQVAYARGTVDGFIFFKRLLKSFESIFIFLALVVVLGIFFLSDWLSINWISTQELDLDTVSYCITLMGGMIALRLFSSLYRSGIVGLEHQVLINIINVIVISIKFIGALILLSYITIDIKHFFEYQLFVGFTESLILIFLFYKNLPSSSEKNKLISFDWEAVKSVAPYTLGIAYTAGIWILITQADKLILSTVLTLSEFGYFSLVALVAGGIIILSGPIAQAVIPRLTMLVAQDRQEEMLRIYSLASQVTILFSLSLALMIGLYAEPLIFAWTGELEAAKWGGNILIWFALGNGVLSIGAFQYYLQSAFGQLKLHVLGSTISAVIQVPLIYYAATMYGAIGAGITWFGFRCIWFFVWTPIVHRQLVPGFHMRWLLRDILPIIIVVIGTGLLIHNNITLSLQESRLSLFIQMIVIGILLVGISLLSLSLVRSSVKRKFFVLLNLSRGMK